ncbi:MAG: amidohydrolase family protein [Spirochaetota bacterium]
MSEQYIEAHVHMDAWDAATKRRIRESGVAQYWVMDISHPQLNTKNADRKTILRAAHDMPGRIIPFAMIQWGADERQVEAYFRAGFTGLKAIVPPKPYNDNAYLPIYEAAAHFAMPILFHTGIIAHSNDTVKEPLRRGYGPANMEPAFLATIADMFPSLELIGGHMGFPYTEQTENNLYYYPNIHHDISGYVSLEWLMSVLERRACAYLGGARFFHEKLLLATDLFIGNKNSELWGKEKREAWRLFFKYLAYNHSWSLEADNIFYRNAKRLMDKVQRRQASIRARLKRKRSGPGTAIVKKRGTR